MPTALGPVCPAQAPAPASQHIPHDAHVLDRARTQWQFGDWESLAEIACDTLQHHPERAKLALLAAAGHLQQNDPNAARQLIRLSYDWGVDKKLVSQILIAGVRNTLGRAAAISGHQARALKHFEAAMAVGMPGSDTKLLTQARIGEQLCQLGLNASGRTIRVGVGETVLRAFPHPETAASAEAISLEEIHHAWQAGRWEYLASIDNAEMVSQPNRAELAVYAAAGYQQLDDMVGLRRCSRLAVEWGCPRDKLKCMLAAGIRNTLAILEILTGKYESAAKTFIAALKIGVVAPKPQIVKDRIRRQLKSLKNIDAEQVLDGIASHLN